MVSSSERNVSARLCESHRSRVTTLPRAVAVSYRHTVQNEYSYSTCLYYCNSVIIKHVYSIKFCKLHCKLLLTRGRLEILVFNKYIFVLQWSHVYILNIAINKLQNDLLNFDCKQFC